MILIIASGLNVYAGSDCSDNRKDPTRAELKNMDEEKLIELYCLAIRDEKVNRQNFEKYTKLMSDAVTAGDFDSVQKFSDKVKEHNMRAPSCQRVKTLVARALDDVDRDYIRGTKTVNCPD